MPQKGEYTIADEVEFRQVGAHPRTYGLMFNPAGSASRLEITDSGKRYEIRLTDKGSVQYSLDGSNWNVIEPLRDPCSGEVLGKFRSYNRIRDGENLKAPRFDMIAVGRGRILAKEEGTDRIFHLVMDEIFRTHHVDGCKKPKFDDEDPPVPGAYFKLDPEFFVADGPSRDYPAELDISYSRHPASARFKVFREVLKLQVVDLMLIAQHPRVWYLVDSRSPLMITGPDDLHISESNLKRFFEDNPDRLRSIVETAVDQYYEDSVQNAIGSLNLSGLGTAIGASLGGIVGAIAGSVVGGVIGALGGAMLGAIGGAIVGGIVVPFIADQLFNAMRSQIIDQITRLGLRSIRCEGLGALYVPAILFVLKTVLDLRKLPYGMGDSDACPPFGNRALDSTDGHLAVNPQKALDALQTRENQPLTETINELMQEARGGVETPNQPPDNIPVYHHFNYIRTSDGEIQRRLAIDFTKVLDLGVGYSHWSEHWQKEFGTEMNNLVATRPLFQQERYNLIQYRLLNGPVIDSDGFNDGTCNFYLLVKLRTKKRSEAVRYAILWMDEQSYISQRWRLLHPTDDLRGDWFSLGRVLADNERDDEDWFRYRPDRFWSPLDAGYIDDRSRMRVRRQLLCVTGHEPNSEQHQIYTICFNYGVCDHSWRWRPFPTGDQFFLDQETAGGESAHIEIPREAFQSKQIIFVNSLELRDDLTLHVRGFTMHKNERRECRWFQSYLPGDSRHVPWFEDLLPLQKPAEGFDHPWAAISDEAFQRADKYYQFGVFEDVVDSRSQYYELDLLDDDSAHPLPAPEITSEIWHNDASCGKGKQLYIDTNNVNLESLEADDGGYIHLDPNSLVEKRRKLKTMSMYESTTRFKLLERKPLGLIAVFNDKRDDELQSATHLPFTTVLCNGPGGKAERKDHPHAHSRHINVIFRSNRRVNRSPIVKHSKMSRTLDAGRTLSAVLSFWTPLTEAEVYENIWKFHLGALDGNNRIKLFEAEIFENFKRLAIPQAPLPFRFDGSLGDAFHYQFEWTGFDTSTEGLIDKYCTAHGQFEYGTSIWFEDVVGHFATADKTVFD